MASPLSYVKQYGNQLLGRTAAPAQLQGALSAAPAAQGALGAQTFPVNDDAPIGAPLQSSGPQRTGALEVNDAAASPAAAPTKSGSDFWSLAKQTSPEDQEKIADQIDGKLKEGGSSLEDKFHELAASGAIKTPDKVGQKFDRKKMGMFLFEAGLRMANRASQGESTIGALSGGVLDTMAHGAKNLSDAQARDDKMGEAQKDRDLRTGEGKADREARAAEGAADRNLRSGEGKADRDARKAEMDADRILRRDLAKADNMSRERMAKIQSGKDKDTITDADGNVFWKPESETATARPFMVTGKDGEPTQLKTTVKPEAGQITPALLLEQGNKIRAQLDGDVTARVTINGKQVSWRSLDEKAKSEYMDDVKKSMQPKTPGEAESNPYAQWAPK